MKLKLLLVILVALAAAFIGFAYNVTSKNPQIPSKEPSNDRLKWYVAQAKREGRQKVSISSGINEYLGSDNASLDSAFADYTVVVARPIAKRTYERNDNNLATWYKFQILDQLTELKDSGCVGCFSLTPPSDLLPLKSDEFLVPRNGGKLIIDGIEIEQTEPDFPQFEDNHEYLLFLSLYPGRVALTAGGPVGVFAVDQNKSLTSWHKDPDSIQDGIKKNFNNSLDLLKRRSKKAS